MVHTHTYTNIALWHTPTSLKDKGKPLNSDPSIKHDLTVCKWTSYLDFRWTQNRKCNFQYKHSKALTSLNNWTAWLSITCQGLWLAESWRFHHPLETHQSASVSPLHAIQGLHFMYKLQKICTICIMGLANNIWATANIIFIDICYPEHIILCVCIYVYGHMYSSSAVKLALRQSSYFLIFNPSQWGHRKNVQTY